MTALLDVSDLARTYEVRRGAWPFGKVATLHAVDGVSFRLEAGRTLGLVGKSGCGKTTTAKLVLGLVPMTGGRVSVAGEPLPPIGSMEWRAHAAAHADGLPGSAGRARPAAERRPSR